MGFQSTFQRCTTRRRRPLTQNRAFRLLFVLMLFAYVLNPSGFGASLFGKIAQAAQVEETAQTATETDDAAETDAHDEHADSAGEAHDDHGGGHVDPVSEVLLAIVLILFCAKVCGDLFERLKLPAVLGELSVGVLLGNWLLLTGYDNFEFLKLIDTEMVVPGNEAAYVIDILARIGVVLLLFEVGLESRIKEMVSVGVSSMLVAILGVVAPMLLGWGIGWAVIPEAGGQVHAFLGACLCATSVGITARVLKDLNRSQDPESKIILGAAVIDDVLGLIVLAIVSGVIKTGDVEVANVVKIVGLSFGFLAGAIALGAIQFPKLLFRLSSHLRGHGLLVVTSLVICFGFSYLANLVSLAPIVGAFAAGLILEGAHYQDVNEKWKHHELEEAVAPLSALLVPIFFVGMGIQVDLASFRDPSVWTLAAGLTVAAIIGKQVCAWGVREPGLKKLAVGLGMIPRGEVGLIFANEGKSLNVVTPKTYSALVVMIMITTMVTPPLLKWAMTKDDPPTEPGDSKLPTST